jgi:hypothetical protein
MAKIGLLAIRVTGLNTGTVEETTTDAARLSALTGLTAMTAGALTAATHGAMVIAALTCSTVDCRAGAEITNGGTMNGAAQAASLRLAATNRSAATATVVSAPRARARPPLRRAVIRGKVVPAMRRAKTRERGARLLAWTSTTRGRAKAHQAIAGEMVTRVSGATGSTATAAKAVTRPQSELRAVASLPTQSPPPPAWFYGAPLRSPLPPHNLMRTPAPPVHHRRRHRHSHIHHSRSPRQRPLAMAPRRCLRGRQRCSKRVE